MSDEYEGDDAAPIEEASLRERLGVFGRSASALLSTRWELFTTELSAKMPPLARGLLFWTLAAAFLFASILMLTALAAVLLAELLGSITLGLLIVLVVYLALAAGAIVLGLRALSGVKPLSYPITSAEIRKDLDEAFPPEGPDAVEPWQPARPSAEPDGELEDRFRMGSE
ncbi:MAG TPA: phage holin family protein [Thermoanaerobaculia bacterium]